jgi:hypothetical protein
MVGDGAVCQLGSGLNPRPGGIIIIIAIVCVVIVITELIATLIATRRLPGVGRWRRWRVGGLVSGWCWWRKLYFSYCIRGFWG